MPALFFMLLQTVNVRDDAVVPSVISLRMGLVAEKGE